MNQDESDNMLITKLAESSTHSTNKSELRSYKLKAQVQTQTKFNRFVDRSDPLSFRFGKIYGRRINSIRIMDECAKLSSYIYFF